MLTLLDSQGPFRESSAHDASRLEGSSPNHARPPLKGLFVHARPTFPSLSVKSTRTSHINDEATGASVLNQGSQVVTIRPGQRSRLAPQHEKGSCSECRHALDSGVC